MKRLLQRIKRFMRDLMVKGKEAEQKKAGEQWDLIVEELKNRK